MAKPPDQSSSRIPFEDQVTGKLDPNSTSDSLDSLEQQINTFEEQLDSFDEQLDQITVQLDQVSEQFDTDTALIDDDEVIEPEEALAHQDESDSVANESPKTKKRKRRVRTWHVVVGIVISLLLAFLAVAGWFIWDRWYRADDSAQIQGMWYAVKTDVPIFISKDTIEFTPDAVYSYKIDQETKSLEFSLGHLDGSCRYWFLDDGQVLVLADGSGYTEWGSAAEDIARNILNFAQMSTGQALELPSGDGVIALARTPNYGSDENQASTGSVNASTTGSSHATDKSGSASDSSGNSGSSSDSSSTASGSAATTSGTDTASGASSGRDDFGSISDLK